MCATIRFLSFTTGAKPIFLSGFNRRARTASHRKNLIFAPCAAYHGVFMLAYSAVFVLYCKKTARLSHTVLLLQLIPARGRKQFITCNGIYLYLVATYPREGTETKKPWEFLLMNQCCNLSPRGDGNPDTPLFYPFF